MNACTVKFYLGHLSFSLESLVYSLILISVLIVLYVALRSALDKLLTKKNLFLLYMHKGGLGDAFCKIGLIRALRAKHPVMQFIVLTKNPDFYFNIPEISKIVDLRPYPWLCQKILYWGLYFLSLRRAHNFVYKPQKQTPKAKLDANPAWRPHLVELASLRLQIAANFSDVRGAFNPDDTEKNSFLKKFESLDEFAIIAPVGKTSYTPNKEWGFDNYTKVVASFPGVKWVQLGMLEHPMLPGAIDLRGKTDLREMIWLLSRANFVLCGEGLHNHVCGAVGTQCFVVFSGFHYWEIAKYPSTIPILATQAPPCAPCFLKKTCPVPGKPCTNSIRPEQVTAIIREKSSFARKHTAYSL